MKNTNQKDNLKITKEFKKITNAENIQNNTSEETKNHTPTSNNTKTNEETTTQNNNNSTSNITTENNENNFKKRGRIFFKNFPFTFTIQDCLKLFEPFGKIIDQSIQTKENTEKIKGFGFVEFPSKQEALNAIKELNGKEFNRRKIEVNLSKTKEEYQKEQEELKEKEKEQKKEEIVNKPLLNDPERTIFIRNLSYFTEPDAIKEFFKPYGAVLYCKVCKNKESGASKGTAFIMFKEKETVESVMALYNKYANAPYSENTLNPFELEGRNIKLLPAVDKDTAHKMEKDKLEKESEDKRNRKLLYFGLNNTNDFINKENLTDEDQEKREILIKTKKANFNKNPNYHISNTRIQIRNFAKAVTEENLKEEVRKAIEEYCSTLDSKAQKEYNKIKKIKQFKFLRNEKELDKDGNPKSKVIFVQVIFFSVLLMQNYAMKIFAKLSF